MSDSLQIEREMDGAVYEIPGGTEVPQGFRLMGGTVSRTATPDSLAGNIWDSLRNLKYQDYAKTATQGVYNALDMTTPLAEDPAHARSNFQSIAETVVPQTPGAFGRTAGMIAGGGAPGWAASMALPAIGGMIGGAMQGESPLGIGREALQGAGEGILGKAVGAGLGAVRRAGGLSWLGMPGQQALDERAVGQAVGEVSPALGGMRTAADMQATMKGAPGKAALGSEYAGVRDQAEQAVIGQPGFGPAQSGFPAPLSSNQITAPAGGALEKLTGKSAMTFDEAASAIESLRAGRHPLTGTLTGSSTGAAERELKSKAVAELAQGLAYFDPTVAELFRSAEAAYGKGMELIRLFEVKGVLDPRTGGLNMPKLQELAGDKQRTVERMLGPDAWATIREAIMRGAKPPAMDTPGMSIPMMERVYGGAGSSGVHVPLSLPTNYIGNAVSVPSLPFSLGAEAGTQAWTNRIRSDRNPYR